MCPCNRVRGYQCDSCRQRDAKVFAAKLAIIGRLCDPADPPGKPSSANYIARIRAGQD